MFGVGRQGNYLANPQGATDPYWGNVVSLLACNDVYYSSEFGTNATTDAKRGFAAIYGSDLSTVSSPAKFSNSIYINNSDTPQNGTDGGIQFLTNDDFNLGTGSWTWEGWVYTKRTSGLNVVFDGRVAGADISPDLFIYAGKWATYQNGWKHNSVGSVSTNTWYHVALVKNSAASNSVLYINGSAISTVSDTQNYSTSQYRVGRGWNGNDGLYGYVDDVRFTKGVARYTSDFSVPTEAYPTS